jgi:hypothetical protein
MEQVARLQKLSDFYHGAMDDRIGDMPDSCTAAKHPCSLRFKTIN